MSVTSNSWCERFTQRIHANVRLDVWLRNVQGIEMTRAKVHHRRLAILLSIVQAALDAIASHIEPGSQVRFTAV